MAKGAPGWLSWLNIELLISAQVMISLWSLLGILSLFSLCPSPCSHTHSLSLSLSFSKQTLKKKRMGQTVRTRDWHHCFEDGQSSSTIVTSIFFSFTEIQLTNEIIRYLRYTGWWFDLRVYCGRISFFEKFVFITSQLSFLVCMRTFKCCCLSKFQLYSTVFSIVPLSCYTLDPQPLFLL